MANEAHKEPTMEEILASIRKIISDDEPVPARAPVAQLREVTPEPMNDYEDIEDAVVGDMLDETDSMFEAEEAPAPAPVSTKLTGPEFTFEEMLGSARQAAGQPAAEPAPRPRQDPGVVTHPKIAAFIAPA